MRRVEGLDLDDPATAVEGFGSPEVDECPLVAPQAPEPAGWGDRPRPPDPAGGRFTTGDADRPPKHPAVMGTRELCGPHKIKTSSECRLGGEPSKA